MTREQFISEVEQLVVNSHNAQYDHWSQSIDYDGVRRRAGLLYDRVVSRVRG